MYACIRETGRGFFEGVCAPSDATAIFRDPPPPRNAQRTGALRQGSGLKRITIHSTMSIDLA
jgi:hypothetical protein